MKNDFKYLILLIVACTIWACGGNSSETGTTTNDVAKTEATKATDDHAGHDHAGHSHAGEPKVHKASVLSPYIGMWEYNYTVKIRDKGAQEKNEGRWIKFAGDKTFVSGRWGKQLNKGTWSVAEDATLLTLDYEDHLDQVDRTWKPQGVGGEVMIWNGTKENNATGTSIKMARIKTFPAKK